LSSAVELVPAGERTLVELAALFTRSFEGYLVPIAMTPEALAAMLRFDGSDLQLSRVVRVEGEDAGIVLLGRRGNTVRVAAMGMLPEARGKRLGGAALEQLLPELREAQVQTLLLEVIGENERAVRLYERLGFTVQRRLIGFARAEAPAADAGEVVEIDPFDAVAFLAAHGEARLSWQLQPASLWALGWPTRGFSLGEHAVALATQTPGGVALRGICVRASERRQGIGRALVAGVAAALEPGGWNVPPIVPEGLADGFLGALGFEPWRIWQHEMTLPL
jgi:ribosomal protein S18 acetylase RimI-like enzyme